MPSATTLCAFVFSTIVTSALVPLPALASSPVSQSPTAAPASPLTPDVMSKLAQRLASEGVDREMIPVIANNLGVAPKGQTWASRSLTMGTPASYVRGFYVSRGSDPDIVVSIILPLISLHAFRAHRDGTVVSAFSADLKTGKITTRTPEEAQPELNAELALWADFVNTPAGK